jgi:endonuclease/exonuclease/phosphatase family metal-dependent hydrolase
LKKLFLYLTVSLVLLSCAINNPDNGKNIPAFGSGDTLAVMTWNLERFPKNSRTVDYVLEAVNALKPDVIALQEISSEWDLYQLANRLPAYDYALGPGGGSWGLAYLYNSDLIELDTVIYEIYRNNSRPFPRPPFVMEMRWNGKKVIVINNHFKAMGDGFIDLSDPWDEETRRVEAVALLHTYMETNFANEKIILLGDLNDEIQEPRHQNVFQLWIDDSLSYRFTNMHIAKGSNLFWSYPSWPSHLDHILISNELFDYHYKTETVLYDTYLDGRWTEYYQYISDHRPVAISLIIPGGEE